MPGMGRKSFSGVASASNKSSPTSSSSSSSKDQTRLKIEQMEAERQQRRRAMKELRVGRAEEEQRNLALGNPGDVDFIGLVRKWREEHSGLVQAHESSMDYTSDEKICVCVRKRPLNDKERRKKEHDAVTCLHPTATVHSAKFKVDGISKYLDHNSFCFDHVFDEFCETEEVYNYTAMPLVGYFCGGKGARATVFAYGQTGSGKSHTMTGIQRLVANDIFDSLSNNSKKYAGCTLENTTCSIAIFELYGGQILDLLNNRNKLKVLEDGKGEIIVTGLEEFAVKTPEDFLQFVDMAQNNRTTHATEANDSSSRSHAICQILLRDKNSGRLKGKLSLVDLAGSERGTDTKAHNKSRRAESSDINTSLLALKECIRAIDSESKHVPYRQSKLTLILKDCFVSKLARTAMIATVSPGSSSTDHTVNTLRYADRIKEKRVGDFLDRRPPNRSKSEPTLNMKSPAQSDILNEFHDNDDVESYSEDTETKSYSDDDCGSSNEVGDDYCDIRENMQGDRTDEEEHLLNMHMSVIQEKAELLTKESQLLNTVQGDSIDMEEYATQLEDILNRKTELVLSLQEKLGSFREQLAQNGVRNDLG
ncbi:hypothetical protein ACHAXS_004376 [Conticribra weissflogii]